MPDHPRSWLAAAALALSACGAPAETDRTPQATQSAAATTDDSAMSDTRAGRPLATGTAVAAGRLMLTREGLGDLVIGQPLSPGSSFAERGAQTSETCRAVSSPDYPNVYAIIENDEVRRITVGGRSGVRLSEGIGIGATVADVLAIFPDLRSTPHKYISAPARYLTQRGDGPRYRFEVAANGRIDMIHVGVTPQLGYVEGCA